ncbi:MAG TPA: metalloregulator ArsR/SmtB family transcription factor [Micromonosporaceae bacterium]|jgi:ArsR family transcriptional regulator|nr:metalloregulator ArsR/SmtB family transcription factor [Micromonosporaceae bacterium]
MSKQDEPLGWPDGCCPPLAVMAITAADAAELAPALKALGDPVRLQLLSMIASNPAGEICVCNLTPAFDLSGPTISHHLKVLREAGLVSSERRASWVYYRVIPEALAKLSVLLDVAGAGTPVAMTL